MKYLWLLIILIISYLMGSISTSIIFGKLTSDIDIRTQGSGNAGATNTLRVFGKKAAVIVTLGDCLKAVLAILIAMLISVAIGLDDFGKLPVYIAGFGAVLGHNFPLYFKFHGGKGVIVSMVALLFADPVLGLVAALSGILIIAITRYVSVGSMSGACIGVILAFVFRRGDLPYVVFICVLAALAIFMHRANIARLISGTESKLGVKKEG